MKQLIRFVIVSNLIISSTTFAIGNPVQGFYGGLLAGISHGPTSNQLAITPHIIGTVSYSQVGAGGGGVLGYKLANFRAEAELIYNRISTGPLRVNTAFNGNSYSCTLQNSNILTPTGTCPPGVEASALGYQGSSAVTYGFFNLYYDIFTPYSHTNLIPYIGVGIGEGYIRNFSNFVNTDTLNSHGSNVSYSAAAVQGILGLGYSMDDFTWCGMDLRYSTTKKSSQTQSTLLQNKSYNLISLMFNINFAFDKGAIDFG